jgi:hypothetical protein
LSMPKKQRLISIVHICTNCTGTHSTHGVLK